MATQSEIERIVGAIPGVLDVSVDTVKPGVFRVRVVGGSPSKVRAMMGLIKAAGTIVVIEHQANPSSAPIEMFL